MQHYPPPHTIPGHPITTSPRPLPPPPPPDLRVSLPPPPSARRQMAAAAAATTVTVPRAGDRWRNNYSRRRSGQLTSVQFQPARWQPGATAHANCTRAFSAQPGYGSAPSLSSSKAVMREGCEYLLTIALRISLRSLSVSPHYRSSSTYLTYT